MNRLNRMRAVQAKRQLTKALVLGIGGLLVVTVIIVRLHHENAGYQYGSYNHHMCVEVYGESESCNQ